MLFCSAYLIFQSLTHDFEALELFKNEILVTTTKMAGDVEQGEAHIEGMELDLKAIRCKILTLKSEVEVSKALRLENEQASM